MSTLRRSAAFAIDKLSHLYPSVVFNLLRPSMESYLVSEDVEAKECAILVLGAISDSNVAVNSMSSHLANLIPFLI